VKLKSNGCALGDAGFSTYLSSSSKKKSKGLDSTFTAVRISSYSFTLELLSGESATAIYIISSSFFTSSSNFSITGYGSLNYISVEETGSKLGVSTSTSLS